MANIKETENALILYNSAIDDICNKIQQLKINKNANDLQVKELLSIADKMSVVNNIKSRKQLEKLFEKVRREFGIYLEDSVKESM